jgi:hypothetical protein
MIQTALRPRWPWLSCPWLDRRSAVLMETPFAACPCLSNTPALTSYETLLTTTPRLSCAVPSWSGPLPSPVHISIIIPIHRQTSLSKIPSGEHAETDVSCPIRTGPGHKLGLIPVPKSSNWTDEPATAYPTVARPRKIVPSCRAQRPLIRVTLHGLDSQGRLRWTHWSWPRGWPSTPPRPFRGTLLRQEWHVSRTPSRTDDRRTP